MPNYDEIIQQSQVNVNALAQKLRELDQLHIDIKKLIKHPETFDAKFVEVRELAESYTKSIGSSVKIFLDGNNTLFIAKLKEMEEVNDSLKNQLGEGKEVKLAIGWKKVFPKFERFTDSVLGRKLSAISKANSIEITEVPHVAYGKVNAYHIKACQLLNESLPELQLNPAVTYI